MSSDASAMLRLFVGDQAAEVTDRPITPQDLTATILKAMGIETESS